MGAGPRQKFPSARQAKCAGLRREFYPAYVREFVDYDYAERLPEEARVWLAAFTEEHYRGWRLKNETQLLPIGMMRESGAANRRRQRAGMAKRLGLEVVKEGALRGVGEHELHSRNETEEQVIRALDRKRSA